MNTLGSRIKAAREQLGQTQQWLAVQSGVSKGFMSDVESDKRNPTVARCMRMAQALGVSVDFLATGNEKPYTCPFCNGSGVL